MNFTKIIWHSIKRGSESLFYLLLSLLIVVLLWLKINLGFKLIFLKAKPLYSKFIPVIYYGVPLFQGQSELKIFQSF